MLRLKKIIFSEHIISLIDVLNDLNPKSNGKYFNGYSISQVITIFFQLIKNKKPRFVVIYYAFF